MKKRIGIILALVMLAEGFVTPNYASVSFDESVFEDNAVSDSDIGDGMINDEVSDDNYTVSGNDEIPISDDIISENNEDLITTSDNDIPSDIIVDNYPIISVNRLSNNESTVNADYLVTNAATIPDKSTALRNAIEKDRRLEKNGGNFYAFSEVICLSSDSIVVDTSNDTTIPYTDVVLNQEKIFQVSMNTLPSEVTAASQLWGWEYEQVGDSYIRKAKIAIEAYEPITENDGSVSFKLNTANPVAVVALLEEKQIDEYSQFDFSDSLESAYPSPYEYNEETPWFTANSLGNFSLMAYYYEMDHVNYEITLHDINKDYDIALYQIMNGYTDSVDPNDIFIDTWRIPASYTDPVTGLTYQVKLAANNALHSANKYPQIATNLVIADGVKFPNDSSYLFLIGDGYNLIFSLHSIIIEGAAASVGNNITNMSHMFYSNKGNCKAGAGTWVSLNTFDIAALDTSNVTDMSYMFYGVDLGSNPIMDISHFNTAKVKDFSYMFGNFYADVNPSQWYFEPVEIDVSNFVTSSAENMEGMFSGVFVSKKHYYSSAGSFGPTMDISHFDFQNVTNMSAMFQNQPYIETIILPTDIDTSKVTNMSNLFAACESLTSIQNLNLLNTQAVTNMFGMFGPSTYNRFIESKEGGESPMDSMKTMGLTKGPALETLDLSNFDTSNVTNMGYMFALPKLTSLTLGDGFDTADVVDMGNMFKLDSILNLDVSGLQTQSVKTMKNMFYLPEANTLTIGAFHFTGITYADVALPFVDAPKLEKLDLSHSIFGSNSLAMSTSALTNCTSLTELKLPANLPDFTNAPLLPAVMYDNEGNEYEAIPSKLSNSIVLTRGNQPLSEVSLNYMDVTLYLDPDGERNTTIFPNNVSLTPEYKPIVPVPKPNVVWEIVEEIPQTSGSDVIHQYESPDHSYYQIYADNCGTAVIRATVNNSYVVECNVTVENYDISTEQSATVSGITYYYKVKEDDSAIIFDTENHNAVSIAIPSELSGHIVTELASETFLNETLLKSLIIPDTVKILGDNIVQGCSSLSTLVIPDSVVRFGDNIISQDFENTILTEVALPNCVTTIAEYSMPRTLSAVTIPDSVTEIYGYAFHSCEQLEEINLPMHLESIGDYAFRGCDKLQSITIPASVTDMGTGTFANCTELLSADIRSKDIGDNTFEGSVSLNNVTLALGVERIGERAFYGCNALNTIILPDTLRTIGAFAFGTCNQLTAITIPTGVTEIEDYAFDKCSHLGEVNIGEGVKKIGAGAFNDCTSINEMTLPDSLAEIGAEAFSGTAIVEITIPGKVKKLAGVFADCSELITVNILGELTEVSDYCFKNCAKLASINIPQSVSVIGQEVFKNCVSLNDIVLPSGIISIGNSAFYGCSKLQVLAFPVGLKSIGGGAFRYCTNLQELWIPNSVTTIGYGAFEYTSLSGGSPYSYYNKQCYFSGSEEEWELLGGRPQYYLFGSLSDYLHFNVGFKTENGKVVYQDINGTISTNTIIEQSGYYYKFGADGAMVKNKALLEGGYLYCFDEHGRGVRTATIQDGINEIDIYSVLVKDGAVIYGISNVISPTNIYTYQEKKYLIQESGILRGGYYEDASGENGWYFDADTMEMLWCCKKAEDGTTFYEIDGITLLTGDYPNEIGETEHFTEGTSNRLSSISLNTIQKTLFTGLEETQDYPQSFQLSVNFIPQNPLPDVTVTWSLHSSNPKVTGATVAEITGEGSTCTVSALNAGTAKVRVTVYDGVGETYTQDCRVSVKDRNIYPKTVTITSAGDVSEIYPEDVLQLSANILPLTTTAGNTVKWSSGNTRIATVDTNGLVTARNAGTVMIRATTQNGISAGLIITVIKDVNAKPLQKISLNKNSVTLNRGNTYMLNVSYEPANTTSNRQVTWEIIDTSEEGVIELTPGTDAQGVSVKLTANKSGTAKVRAKVGNKSALCSVTVENRATSICLNQEEYRLTATENGAEGSSVQLHATIIPENADATEIVWKTDNSQIAAVSNSGLVTAVSDGSTWITATAGNLSTKCKIIVSVGESGENPVITPLTPKVLVTHINISGNKTKEMEVGNTIQLRPLLTVLPENAIYSVSDCTYETSDEFIASVTDTGAVTGKNAGIAKIMIALPDGHAIEVPIKVTAEATQDFVFDKEDIVLYVNGEDGVITENTENRKTKQLHIRNVEQTETLNLPVEYTSSDETVATVDNSGKVTAVGITDSKKKTGMTVITAIDKAGSGKYAVCTVTVKKQAEEIQTKADEVISESRSLILIKGKKFVLNAIAIPQDTTDSTLTYETSDATVVDVQKGTITAKNVGTALVSVIQPESGLRKQVTVSVVAATEMTKSVTISPSSDIQLNKGASITLSANCINASGNPLSDRGVIWSSSNVKVAAVDAAGIVSAVEKGTVTITASASDGSGKKATKRITVVNPVAGITLNKSQMYIKSGNRDTSESLKVLFTPFNANNKEIEWSISGDGSTTGDILVSSGGKVTVKKKTVPGTTAHVTATSKENNAVKASCKIVVTGIPAKSLKTTITKQEVVGLNVTQSITGQLLPSNADIAQEGIVWSSSNEAVAVLNAISTTVSADGNSSNTFTTVGYGSTLLTGKTADGVLKMTRTVTVYPLAKSIKLSPVNKTQTIEICGNNVGSECNVEAINQAGDRIDTDMFTYTSSNTKLVYVDDTGRVFPNASATKGGTVSITATLTNDPAKRKVRFIVKLMDKAQVNSIRVEKNVGQSIYEEAKNENIFFHKNAQLTYRAFGYDSRGNELTSAKLKWSINDTSLAKLKVNKDKTVTVTILKEGAFRITCQADDAIKKTESIWIHTMSGTPILSTLKWNLNKNEVSGKSTPFTIIETFNSELKISECQITEIKQGKNILSQADREKFYFEENSDGTYAIRVDSSYLDTAKGDYKVSLRLITDAIEELNEVTSSTHETNVLATLSIKSQNPKVSIKKPTINLFDTNADMRKTALLITAPAAVTNIEPLTDQQNGFDDVFAFSEDAGQWYVQMISDHYVKGNLSGKVNITVEGYQPFTVNITIATPNTTPKIVPSQTVALDGTNAEYTKISLINSATKEEFTDYTILNNSEQKLNIYRDTDGKLMIGLKGGAVVKNATTLTAKLKLNNTLGTFVKDIEVKIPVKIYTAAPKISFAKSSFSLNLQASSEVAYTVCKSNRNNIGILQGELWDVECYNSTTKNYESTNDFTVDYQDGSCCIGLANISLQTGTYKLRLSNILDGYSEIAKDVTVKVIDKQPTASVKISGAIDLVNRTKSNMVATVTLNNTEGSVASVLMENNDFYPILADRNQFEIHLKQNANVTTNQTRIPVTLVLQGGTEIDTIATIKPKQSVVKVAVPKLDAIRKSNHNTITCNLQTDMPANIVIDRIR